LAIAKEKIKAFCDSVGGNFKEYHPDWLACEVHEKGFTPDLKKKVADLVEDIDREVSSRISSGRDVGTFMFGISLDRRYLTYYTGGTSSSHREIFADGHVSEDLENLLIVPFIKEKVNDALKRSSLCWLEEGGRSPFIRCKLVRSNPSGHPSDALIELMREHETVSKLIDTLEKSVEVAEETIRGEVGNPKVLSRRVSVVL